MKQVLRTLVFVLVVPISTACGEGRTVRVETPDISKAAAELRTGIEKMDPVGLRTMVEQNDRLKKTIDELKSRLSPLGTVGGVVEVSPKSRVCFEITNYTGSFRLDAWVNSPDNWFLHNKVLPGSPLDLGIQFDLAQAQERAVNDKHYPNRPQHIWYALDRSSNIEPSTIAIRQDLKESYRLIDRAYSDRVNAAFKQFLDRPGALPSADLQGCHNVDLRLKWSERDHSVFVGLTPEATDERGKWTFEYKTYLKRQDAGEERIGSGRIDSDTSKNWRIGEPVTQETARFFVKIVDDPK